MKRQSFEEFNYAEEIYYPLETDNKIKSGSKGVKVSAKGSSLDRRRQVHVKCEHRRRKEIQEALEALEAELPMTSKPRSKGAIIVDSADMIKELTFRLDRLLNENQLLLNRKQVEELTK